MEWMNEKKNTRANQKSMGAHKNDVETFTTCPTVQKSDAVRKVGVMRTRQVEIKCK